MRRPGEALSRVQLLDAAWDIAFESHSNVVDVYVRYLREKIDRPFGRELARDRARRRVPAAATTADVSRLPIRIRLTLPFAVAMALVLAALGGVRLPPGRLDAPLLDRPDAARPGDRGDAAARPGQDAARPRLGERRQASRRCSTRRRGRRSRSRRAAAPLLERRQLRDGRRRRLAAATRRRRRASGRWRLLAIPDTAGGRAPRARARRARSTLASESLERLRKELLVGSPLALLLATLAGYVLAGAALRPVEEMRRKARDHLGRDAGSRLPVPPARDEISRLAETLNDMLAAARDGVRARAALRRRREPRAPDAARAAQHRARARASPSRGRGPSSRMRCARRPRRPTA